MADRTFHKRFTLTARIGVAVFAILALYIFVAIIIVGMIERILNTTYTFKMVKPIDLDEEMEYLIINEGRFSSNRNVPLCDVIDVHIAKTFFGLDHCVVIEYGHKNIVTVQPDNEEAFMERIKNK